MSKRFVAIATLCTLVALVGCAGQESKTTQGPPRSEATRDLDSWSGIAKALDCTYMSAPVIDKEQGQERSICQFMASSTFVTVVKVEERQETEAAFTTYGQPYTFISDMWVLVGEFPILEKAAKKVGSEVHGQPGEGEVPQDSPSEDHEPEVLPFGEPFDYVGLDSDGGVYEWKITLTKFNCGLNEVEGAVSNPDWEGDDSVPEYISAEAPEGKDFCVAYWTQENAGNIPGGLDGAGDIMIGDERHAKSADDDQATWDLWRTNLDVTYTDPINPGDSGKTMDMWTVPEGAEATAIWFPAVNMVQEEYYLVATS